MFKCHVCGSQESRQVLVHETFQVGGKLYLAEQIPAEVCCHCSEGIFSRDTTERIRAMVHGQAKPMQSIPVDLSSYSSELKTS